ncbi:Fe-S cluster assembly protein NifU [Brachyspira pilosicoli]|uniref:Nitrogen fixation protein NifU n=1 Tax=Brachyspira pilosicoli TaxID=52584 RepID=A0A5C8FFH1_BRAPL|nr:Fe-S cluster assembly protein NifU [Brachyspira pilosicoli]TXJ47380.1 Fe-S cluster assembly protein NifU [Brachyspira pilosicoli]
MWEYTDKVKDHFINPRNVGEIENADAEAMTGSIVCGDALKLTLKINKDTEVIEDAKFQTFGCASAIASSSILTEMIKGKTLDEAKKITNRDIAMELGGLPEEKMHCSVMGMETLEKAINNYRGINVEEDEHDEGAIICKCFGVTDTKIKRAIRENNLTTVDEITFYTKAGGGCGACKVKLEDILNEELAERERLQKNAPLTTVQKIKKIEEAIETVINPMLKMDGGSCKLVDIEGNIVKISFKGACSSCMASKNTLKGFVEPKIKELVDKDLEVVGV